MGLFFLRILFILIFIGMGYVLGGTDSIFFAAIGAAVGIVVVLFEVFARRVSLKGLSSAVFGIMLGLLLAWIFSETLNQFSSSPDFPSQVVNNIRIFVTFIFVYLGLTLGLKGKDDFHLIIPYIKFKRQELKEEIIVMDTSVIIDGRILDLVKTRFIEAKFLVPRFVLNELHALSDSTDHMKRQKGKRGIEILHSLKQEPNIDVEIYDKPVEGVKSVDEKIIRLGQEQDAKVMTTDYNLNRIAQLQGVGVLNINDLANALKPTFVAGQRFQLKLIKEGKEQSQAIGYLEDGTMVVVEGGRRLIGKIVTIEVTSILQSSSGRIVFTKLAK
ncbi:MAG: TRAM domain-containing protein [Candidatus Omnitrophica bacterium]|nr:TRAM domain-containing protein [Candidatus Omnitrophota bacterium]